MKFLKLLLPLLGLFLAAPLYAASVNVTVADESMVPGPRVTLGEVAEFQVLNSAGAALAEQLARIDLGLAPAPGQIVTLRRGQLEQRLNASGLNLGEAGWSLPAELRLVGQGQALSEGVLRQALENYLADLEPYRSGRFELASLSFGQLPTLPPGRAAYRFVPQSSANPTHLTGTFFFAVDGREVGRSRVTAQIDLYVPALVAATNLARGQVLTERDLTLATIPYAQAKGSFTAPEIAVGQTLKNNLAAGEPLRDRYLAKSVVVRRGDMVTIVAQQGGLRVTASGQARQDGALGETISVVNVNSKKVITARVIGPNQVEIVF